jgi:thioredoxin-related protein
MKKILIAIAMLCIALPLWAQTPVLNTTKNAPKAKKEVKKEERKDTKEMEKPYDEKINAMEQIDKALEQIRGTHRLLICQVGGNWCPWCLKFNKFINEDKEISQFVADNFVYIHVNTSKANKNYEAMKRLGNPGRFGYPALVVLNEEGRVLHIQNSAYLEDGQSYDRKKVLAFFQNWTREAIDNIK